MDVYIKTPDAANPSAKALNPQQTRAMRRLSWPRSLFQFSCWLAAGGPNYSATSCGAKTVDSAAARGTAATQ